MEFARSSWHDVWEILADQRCRCKIYNETVVVVNAAIPGKKSCVYKNHPCCSKDCVYWSRAAIECSWQMMFCSLETLFCHVEVWHSQTFCIHPCVHIFIEISHEEERDTAKMSLPRNQVQRLHGDTAAVVRAIHQNIDAFEVHLHTSQVITV